MINETPQPAATQIQTGGCHCGALRYRVKDPLEDVAHCHCSICRRVSGATLMTWATVPLEVFTWITGTPALYASSPNCTRYFCAHCGAHLALWTQLSPHTLDISLGGLDHPERMRANRHIWVGSRLPHLILDPQLPEEWEEQL